MDPVNLLLQYFGAFIAVGGGLAVVVYNVFKYLAAKWLDAKFDERLQALKHEQGKEIEQLKFKISQLLDRAVKLHQREFEALPEAWSKLNQAFGIAHALLVPFQQYPDINRMPANQQREFIANCSLPNWVKQELLEAGDKNALYMKHITWHNLDKSQREWNDSYTYSLKNGIFFGDDVRDRFGALHDLIWKALLARQITEQYGRSGVDDAPITAFHENGGKLLKELEQLVRDRLWPKETATS